MIKIIKIIIVITIIIWWMGTAETVWAVIKKAGNIEVITDEPLFADSIVWYPGLRIEKSFQVKNRGNGTKTVQIEALSELDSKNLADVLTFEARESGQSLYGSGSNSKTLQKFYDDQTVSLSDVPVNDDGKVFDLIVAMPAAAGNEYQGGRAEFDLRIGFAGDSVSAVTVSGGGTTTATPTPTPTQTLTLGVEVNMLTGGETILGEEATPTLIPEEYGSDGEVAGSQTEGIDWRILAIIGGILVFGGLAGWIWWIRRK